MAGGTFVSVAVPYSSVPHTYSVLYPRLRQYLRRERQLILTLKTSEQEVAVRGTALNRTMQRCE